MICPDCGGTGWIIDPVEGHVPCIVCFCGECLLTPDEAQKAYDEAEEVPLSEERIQEIVDYATGRNRQLR